MSETWLRTNRRVLLLGMILPVALAVIGLVVLLTLQPVWTRVLAWALIGLGAFLLLGIALQLRQPRIAHVDGALRVYLARGAPLTVPVEHVECFFLGAGAGQLPGGAAEGVALRNLIVRLAERAPEYHNRDVKPALGRWEDGYVTVYGAWCEPLSLELVKSLNARLAEAQRNDGESSRA